MRRFEVTFPRLQFGFELKSIVKISGAIVSGGSSQLGCRALMAIVYINESWTSRVASLDPGLHAAHTAGILTKLLQRWRVEVGC